MNISALRRRSSRILNTFIAFATIASASPFANAFWGFVPCPRWTYGWEATPQESARKFFTVTYGATCFSGVSCVPDYVNPTTYSCSTALAGTIGCMSGTGTMQASARDGTTNTSPIIHPDTQGFWHCAVSDSEKDPLKSLGDCPICDLMKGNPINMGTGNKFQREDDLRASSAGGLEFSRFYNSQASGQLSPMGTNWTHTWTRWVRILAANEANALRPDGKTYTFRLVSGAWVPDADVTDTLAQTSSGWALTTSKEEVELYDTDGHLTSVATREGLTTTFAYSDGTTSGANGAVVDGGTLAVRAGTLIRAIDFHGRTLQFSYNQAGFLVKLTDPSGNVYRYSYDTSGNLQTVQYPGSSNPTRTYIYNESANTQSTNIPNALTGISDELGIRYATFKYLSNKKASSTEHAGSVENNSFSYDSYWETVTHTDALGTARTSNVTLIQGIPVTTSTTQTCTGCGGTTTSTRTFDVNRNIASLKDFNGNLSCYSYDLTRNLETARTEGLSGSGTCTSRVTTSATRTITTEWQSARRLQKRIAEPLRITTYKYNGDTGVSCAPTGASTALVCSKVAQATTDSSGSSAFTATSSGGARTSSYSYDVNGQLLGVDGPRTDVTDTTVYTYYSTDDTSGNYRIGDLASVTNALSQTTTFTQYDASGRLKKMLDPNSLETLIVYDERGRLTSKQVGTTAAGYEATTYEYDAVSNLKKVILPDASYVSYTYDDARRLTTIQDGLGNKIIYTLDGMGNRTAEEARDVSNTLVRAHTRVIDAFNRLKQDIGGTSPTTQITQDAYDGMGNLASTTDPLSRITTQIYDARNRLTEVRDPFNGTTAPTKYEYNGQDQLTKVTDPANLATSYTVNGHGETTSQVSPDTGTTTFTYDLASNMITKLDARAVQATSVFDALNRLSQITYPDETVTYTYDTCTNGVGRLCTVVDNAGATSYSYDVKGHVTSKSQAVGTLTRTMGYAYNAAGQLSTVTTPSGKQVVYTYANNRPVSVTVDGTKVLDTVFYEPFGPNGGWLWGNSSPSVPNTHTRIFDKDFRAARVTSDLPVSGIQPYFDRQVTWDAKSRVSALADLANSALNATYGYDALDHITSTSQGTATWGYSYSGVGDRLTSTVNSSTTTYSYPATSHRLQSLSGAQTKSYTHDSVGNQTSDGAITWTYAGNNRPTQAGTTTFLINALGQRLKKTSAAGTTHFVYDEAGRLWGEYDATGALITETIWLDELPVGIFKSALSYVHPDHLGTPRMVTRASDNAILWRWDNTEAFGNSAPNDNPSGLGSFAFNLRFPGQYYDIETGKHYNYYRDYDPAIGRYIESDPIGLEAGLNTYAYVRGRPVSSADPKGLLDTGPGGENQEPSGQGHCTLLAPVPIGMGHTLCVFICKNFECPPKVWVETDVSNWIHGCLDKRAARGRRGVEGPRRPS